MDIFTITTQEILDRISRHCPEALSTYLQCLNRADQDKHVLFTKYMIQVDMSEDYRRFKTNIKKLALENLLEWHPYGDGLSVKMAEIDDE